MPRGENQFLLKSANFFSTKEKTEIRVIFRILEYIKRKETFFSINLPIL